MVQYVKRFSKNELGRDFAVGDIHGHFTRLQAALDAAGFNPEVDRLFSVGDLVDRGPESNLVDLWLAKPWFHAVRGNHDDYVCRLATVDRENWIHNGGQWFFDLPEGRQHELCIAMQDLPIAIEVETEFGKVGIVHADCPLPSWPDFTSILENYTDHPGRVRRAMASAMWLRERVTYEDTSGVKGLHALVVGHTTHNDPVVLGNVYHIDTAGWHHMGRFTLLDLRTLATIPPMRGKLVWE